MLPLYAFMDKQEKHSMQRRNSGNNYTHPGIYHITITISDRKAQSLGRVIGDVQLHFILNSKTASSAKTVA